MFCRSVRNSIDNNMSYIGITFYQFMIFMMTLNTMKADSSMCRQFSLHAGQFCCHKVRGTENQISKFDAVHKHPKLNRYTMSSVFSPVDRLIYVQPPHFSNTNDLKTYMIEI